MGVWRTREKWPRKAGGIPGGGRGSRVDVKRTCSCPKGGAFVYPSKHHQRKDTLAKLGTQ